MRRYSYEESRSSGNIWWSTDQHGRRIKKNVPIPNLKGSASFQSFGFFGPEFQNQPTVITTGGSTPLILVHPPSPTTHTEQDSIMGFVLKERHRHEKSLRWQRQRTKREAVELVLAERDDLQVPPAQFTRKVRYAYAEDNKERYIKRLQRFLRQDTIDTLSDNGSDLSSKSYETVCDEVGGTESQQVESTDKDSDRRGPERCIFQGQNKAALADIIAVAPVLLFGHVWMLFG